MMAYSVSSSEKNIEKKARYFYLKGAEKEAEGDIDEAFGYYRKAFSLLPSYTEPAFSYAIFRTALLSDAFRDGAEIERALRIMRPYIDSYPADANAGQSYAYIAMQADSLGEALRVFEILNGHHPGLSSIYIPMSYGYFRKDSIEKALDAVRQFERLEGVTTETLMRKASYHLANNDTLGALREFREYADKNSSDPRALIDRAMLNDLLAFKDSAEQILNEGRLKFPDNGEIIFNLAHVKLELGDTLAFHNLIREALHAPDSEYEDRLDILTQYVESLPLDSTYYEISDATFAEMEKEFEDDIFFLNILTSYSIRKQDYKTAYKYIKRAFAEDETNVNLLGKLIAFSVLTDQASEGVEAFDSFSDQEAKKTFTLSLSYITAAQTAKEYGKALAWCDTLLRMDVPSLSLADISVDKDSVSALDPDTKDRVSVIYEIAGDVYAQSGAPKGAVRSYENSISVSEANASVLNNYAYFIVETLKARPGSVEFDKAKDMSYKSLKLTENAPEYTYYDTYAWILFKEQNYKDALTYQEFAIEAAGDDPAAELLMHYGDILFMSGRPEEAVEQWERALKKEPDNEVLKKKVEHKTFFYE